MASRVSSREQVLVAPPSLADAIPDGWDSEATNENCTRPLPGRESEYETVVAFVDARLHTVVHHGSLFVFGACGCGKTSTVLRALRSFTRRCLPSDRQVRGAAEGGRAATTASSSSSSSLHSTPARSAATRRRSRGSGGEATAGSTARENRPASPPVRFSQAVKKAKLEVSPSESSAAAGSVSAADSPLTSAGHVSSATDTPLSASTTGRLSDGIAVSGVDAGRALFADKLSPAERHHRLTDVDEEEEEGGDVPAAPPYSPEYFQLRYSRLYTQRSASSTVTSKTGSAPLQFVQAHYINCADLDAQQLAEALHKSIKSTAPRPDVATQCLLDGVASLPQTARRHSSTGRANTIGNNSGVGGRLDGATGAKANSKARLPTLHVVALDEVEYVRGAAARDVLSCLSALSFTHPTQLALIFISNHRDLVHVPSALLDELPFEPYSIAQLKRIGSAVVQVELAAAQREEAEKQAALSKPVRGKRSAAKTRADASASCSASTHAPVQISPTLLEYIARKALLDCSGDVRQVMAMCRRVIFTALEETRATASAASEPPNARPSRRGAATGKAKTANEPTAALTTKLQATVDAFKAVGSGRRVVEPVCRSACSSTRSSGAQTSNTDAGADTTTATAPVTPRAPHTLTLANTATLLHSSAVETQVQKHISTMPEQQLYVLCCMVVLALRHQRDAARAAVAVGSAATGRMRSRHGTAATPTTSSMAVREVRQLYTGLMGLRHFPSMNSAGITTAVDGLADLGIITRPQRRGNDEVFTFNGTWSLDAMQGALENRGEALRQELASCGLDASENKFTSVLRELKTLAGLQGFA